MAIVGAGPFGLAVAAHLRAAGMEPRVFGRTMEFWQRNMPEGMLLRSAREASHISDPRRELTLDDYEADRGRAVPEPVPLEDFVDYGQWFQRQAVPTVDRRTVHSVDLTAGGFRLELGDGEQLQAERVVLATGLARFPRVPPTFAGLPRELVSHSCEHVELGQFSGRSVLVIGGGQSALESAALVHETGADVEVVIRAPRIHWLVKGRLAQRLGPAKRILYPPTDVGPPGLNWIIALPNLFRSLPDAVQVPAAKRAIRPAGAEWLRPRLRSVRLTIGRVAVSAEEAGDGIRVRLDDGSVRQVGHVILATGYRIEVSGYHLLAPRLLGSLAAIRGYPQLRAGFESSVSGLHFVGASAAESFGPLMRFVAGTGYTGRAVTRSASSRARTRRSLQDVRSRYRSGAHAAPQRS